MGTQGILCGSYCSLSLYIVSLRVIMSFFFLHPFLAKAPFLNFFPKLPVKPHILIRLATISLYIFLSVFSYFLHFYIQWKLADEIFTNALIKNRKNIHASVNEKRKTEKRWTLFYNGLFYKRLYNDNYFFYFTSSFVAQVLLFDIIMA